MDRDTINAIIIGAALVYAGVKVGELAASLAGINRASGAVSRILGG